MKQMKLRTEIGGIEMSSKVEYGKDIFAIGSCFAERIGSQLEGAKFSATVNPTGVLFNPLSIASTIGRLAERSLITVEELQPFDSEDANGGWFHYDFHSSLSAPTASETVARINAAIEMSHEALKSAEVVIITLGTAWIYELVESGDVVANCHKRPACNFSRRRLSVAQIVEQLGRTIEQHLAGKSVILTLSPIRHVADGLAENSLSKATLRVAIDEIVEQHAGVEYFPAYEMLIDDLRDYRFYESDMVHPSQVATEYIFDHFCSATMSEKTRQMMGRVEQVVRAASHRPQNVASQSHRDFCKRQVEAIDRLRSECGAIDVESEMDYFSAQLR